METQNFSGVWTALVTPFLENGEIDFKALDNLVDRQISAGVTGVLVNGTTGESPTLTDSERSETLRHVVQYVNGRCLVMMGTGTNCTSKSIDNTIQAEGDGADIVLVVNPYYNKPTQTGLYLHFEAVAKATKLPVVLYNIKGRTGVNLETDTLLKLSNNYSNIVAVKEASGDKEQILDVCSRRREGFLVLSGDDGLTCEIMKEGGANGVISVASNIMPNEVNKMVQFAMQGNWSEAENLNNNLKRLFSDIFLETNPTPAKYILAQMGLCQNVFRLPMCPVSDGCAVKLDETLIHYNLK